MSARLALGTAQFGMPYGVANKSGKPDLEEVSALLSVARTAGVEMLDTAILYGEAEVLLGNIGVQGWKVVTKLPAIPDTVTDIQGWMEAHLEKSLWRLGVERLHGVLLHAPDQMRGSRAALIARALDDIKCRDFSTHVGVSIQTPDADLPSVLSQMTPGIIQSPFNLLDDCLISSGWAEKLRKAGCEVHTRSTFLQGLLLMEPLDRPAWFERWNDHWKAFDHWLNSVEINAFEACIRSAFSQPDVDYVVVGMEKTVQLKEILNMNKSPLKSWPIWPTCNRHDLINPSRWPSAWQ